MADDFNACKLTPPGPFYLVCGSSTPQPIGQTAVHNYAVIKIMAIATREAFVASASYDGLNATIAEAIITRDSLKFFYFIHVD